MFLRAPLCLIALGACGRIGFDAASPDAGLEVAGDAAIACAVGPWGPLRSQTALQTPVEDWEATLHPDGLVMVFVRQTTGNADLFVTTRRSPTADFGTPISIPAAATPMTVEFGVAWSPDGTQISYRFDDGSDWEVRVLDYLGGTSFSPAFSIGDMPGDSFSWDISPDGLELFFTTLKGTLDYDLGHATRATLTSPWIEDQALASLNRTGMSEGWPAFDAARGIVYFERADPSGAVLAEATRPAPGAAFALSGTTMILADQDGDPDLSADGLTLVFSSRRNAGAANDIFLTTRSCL